MYEFIQKFHSGWAYLALLLLIVAVVISFSECFLKEFTAKNRKIALFALIAIHVQLLVGIILYFVSPNGLT
jgi:heme A synthase